MHTHRHLRNRQQGLHATQPCDHELEWWKFRRWANTVEASDVNRRLRILVKTNPIALKLWEEYSDRLTRGAYKRSIFWDGNHSTGVETSTGLKNLDYSGLNKYRN